MFLCKKKGWLRCPARFILIFDVHDCNLVIVWNRKRLPELVYLFESLLSKELIKVMGNRGFWSVLEKHLVDFDGKPIKSSLYNVWKKLDNNREYYKLRTDKVDKVMLDVIAVHTGIKE